MRGVGGGVCVNCGLYGDADLLLVWLDESTVLWDSPS